jgi:hypothetical protein
MKIDLSKFYGMQSGSNTPSSEALIIVDVQPEYWSSSPAVSSSFPEFPLQFQRCLSWARSRGLCVTWIRCEYNNEKSPWLTNFAKLNPDKQALIEFNQEDLLWEDFAVPVQGEAMVIKVRCVRAVSYVFLRPDLESPRAPPVFLEWCLQYLPNLLPQRVQCRHLLPVRPNNLCLRAAHRVRLV